MIPAHAGIHSPLCPAGEALRALCGEYRQVPGRSWHLRNWRGLEMWPAASPISTIESAGSRVTLEPPNLGSQKLPRAAMPNATIEVRRRYTTTEESGIIDAVHAAMMKGLKIPEWDKTVRLVVHEPHRFPQTPDKGERYTLVDIDLFSGRSLESKKSLYQAVWSRISNRSAFPVTRSRFCCGRVRRRTGASEAAFRHLT